MRSARLGITGRLISRLGLGGWQAGGTGRWGAGPSGDEDEAVAAIRFGIERGIDWVDTAASYGLGRSEEVVARALQPWRIGEEVLVFTKCGHPWEGTQPRTDLRPESIRAECEGSLRRLGVERIDLLQFHHPDPSVPVEDSWGAAVELVERGKVRWIGLSNFGADLLGRCEAIRHVDSVQPELSLVAPAAAAEVLPWCAANGAGAIVYSPLGNGILSGAKDPRRIEEVISSHPERGGGEGVLALVDRLRAAADSRGVSVSALAIAWALGVEGATGAICGARRPEQVGEWLDAADLELGRELRSELDLLSGLDPGPRSGA
jgi:aryl-alcohol dehydrogenase-like predicted oxidoreductase